MTAGVQHPLREGRVRIAAAVVLVVECLQPGNRQRSVQYVHQGSECTARGTQGSLRLRVYFRIIYVLEKSVWITGPSPVNIVFVEQTRGRKGWHASGSVLLRSTEFGTSWHRPSFARITNRPWKICGSGHCRAGDCASPGVAVEFISHVECNWHELASMACHSRSRKQQLTLVIPSHTKLDAGSNMLCRFNTTGAPQRLTTHSKRIKRQKWCGSECRGLGSAHKNVQAGKHLCVVCKPFGLTDIPRCACALKNAIKIGSSTSWPWGRYVCFRRLALCYLGGGHPAAMERCESLA